jgi:hypothetical protein
MNGKIYKFVLNDILHRTLKIGHTLGYFQIWEHLCALVIVGKENSSQLIFVTILQLSIWLLWSFALEMI